MNSHHKFDENMTGDRVFKGQIIYWTRYLFIVKI